MTFKDPRRQKQLEKLILKLGLSETSPVNWSLLDLALTHPTVSPTANYEQLEFIGDSVVRLAASEFLWEIYPDATVGDFSAIRKVLVSDRILAQIASIYGLDRYLLVSNSAAGDKAGQVSRMANTFEAVLGALYLSTHNLQLIRPWLDNHLQELSTEILLDPARLNYKDALQEFTQAHHKVLPEYRVQDISQTHGDSERFSAEVWLNGKKYGKVKDNQKKQPNNPPLKMLFSLCVSQKFKVRCEKQEHCHVER